MSTPKVNFSCPNLYRREIWSTGVYVLTGSGIIQARAPIGEREMDEKQRMQIEIELERIQAENEELRRERDAVREENVALQVAVNQMVRDRMYVVL